MQSDYAWPTMVLGALTALSVAADWWRHRTRKPGSISWIPWSLIAILSLIGTAFCAAAWLQGR